MSATHELNALKAVLVQMPDLKLALAFGSVAAGDPRPDSDLDIALLTAAPLDACRKREWIAGLAQVTGRSIDLIDLSTVGEPLLGEILKGGIRLFGSDGDYAELLKRHLFDQADFLPYRNRLLAERRGRWLKA